MHSILKISDLSAQQVFHILRGATALKHAPQRYAHVLQGQTLLMFFQKPSLRTRVSFEVGMTQLGGHAIYYDTSSPQSTLGSKETLADTALTASRYVDLIMARFSRRQEVRELANKATVPVINGLDDFAHPCQILADLLTIQHRFQGEDLSNITVAYVGDIANNVTYDLMRAAALLGFKLRVAGPDAERHGAQFAVEEEVLRECRELEDGRGKYVEVLHDAERAVHGADVVYTDSWMSYHLDPKDMEARAAALASFQVTQELMSLSNKGSIFMHCLPAVRGCEVCEEVIDGDRSVVFDQAENRLHAQKALMMYLLKKLE